MMKNQKGITLIALVITIIVLLILAGVSIAMLTGENGLLTKASTAGTETKKASTQESVKLAIAEIIADNEGFPTAGLTGTGLKDAIDKVKEDKYTVECNDEASTTDSGETKSLIKVDFKTGADSSAKVEYTYYVTKASGVVSETK